MVYLADRIHLPVLQGPQTGQAWAPCVENCWEERKQVCKWWLIMLCIYIYIIYIYLFILYVYMYAYIHTYIHTYMYTNISIYIYTHIFIYIHIYIIHIYLYIYICVQVCVGIFTHACIYTLCYESQPKAWAEYRYKAKLIQGAWEGRRPIWAILGRWSPELGAGTLKKGWAPLRRFEAWKRRIEGNLTPRIKKNGGVRLGGFFF